MTAYDSTERSMKTIDERIAEIEAKFLPSYRTTPGTSLTRVLANQEERGMEWCLGVGVLQEPLLFFRGRTIEDCLLQAESDRHDCPKCKNSSIRGKTSGIACITPGCGYWFCY